ncbi:MAG TPA: relaxase/mobilization nuclease domain-containing protein [Gemmatimonadaceae bacterium]|nr:relaxase/mobilization nuclease domain-containing protein [Gemmatimonadaceae bacterium]
MIAVCSSGKSFGALADYLTEPKNGVDRVEWTSTRNLPVDDPDLAGRVMEATAAENVRVEKPVYHIAVSFHPGDVVTQQQMERVADRLLDELGLGNHQALIVAHNDRPHAHFHIMVNRIDPETTRAWDRWQDYPAMQRVMREQERALGLHEVRSSFHERDGHSRESHVTSGEYREAKRTGTEPLLDRIKAHAPELRAAQSWEQLESKLAEYGFEVERKGQGLVFTDGQTEVKASRVHRELSFGKLEQRLGSYDEAHRSRGPDHEAPSTRQPTHGGTVREPTVGAGDRAPSPLHQAHGPDLAREAAELVRDLSRLKAIERAIERAQENLASDRAHFDQLESAAERARYKSDQFDQTLTKVYARPEDAREHFDQIAKTEGFERAARRMEHHPEAFGTLRPTEHKAVFGLVTRTEYDTARGHAGDAAAQAYAARAATDQLRVQIEGHRGPAVEGLRDYSGVRAELGDRIRNAEQHLDKLGTMRDARPTRGELVRELRHTVRDFGHGDLNRFAGQVTQPQYDFALRVARGARHVLLGREEGLGR